jgi:argininosuccinate lyase
MANKLYTGRLKSGLHPTAELLNESLRIDMFLYEFDIIGSIVHAKMLGRTGILTKKESDTIVKELESIRDEDPISLVTKFKDAEDVHTLIEFELVDRIGDLGKKLHTGRSRNDQVAFDLSLATHFFSSSAIEMVEKLIEGFKVLVEANGDLTLPGYTHLQRAQSVKLSTHLQAYIDMFYRDSIRLQDCIDNNDILPLGAAALNGSSFPIDPKITIEELDNIGFDFYLDSFNSPMDAVSNRDFMIDLMYCLSMIMMHLSRLSEELILWQSFEFGFVNIPDDFSTGSSIMPQKKNPDICEIVRSKAPTISANLNAAENIMKALPLTYNKDFQEMKYLFFQSYKTVEQCLEAYIVMIPKLTFNKEKMLNATKEGYLNATEVANYLTRKGLPFRDAYKISGELVAYAMKKSKTFEELSLDDFKKHSDKFDEDVYLVL